MLFLLTTFFLALITFIKNKQTKLGFQSSVLDYNFIPHKQEIVLKICINL